MGFLKNKRILITGVISNRSIAYGIAKACHQQGAELAFTYVGDRFKARVTEYAAEFGSSIVLPCDVGDDAQIESAIAEIQSPIGTKCRNNATTTKNTTKINKLPINVAITPSFLLACFV